MKRYKVISATALAAMLVTSSSTFVYAAEKETTMQHIWVFFYFQKITLKKQSR